MILRALIIELPVEHQNDDFVELNKVLEFPSYQPVPVIQPHFNYELSFQLFIHQTVRLIPELTDPRIALIHRIFTEVLRDFLEDSFNKFEFQEFGWRYDDVWNIERFLAVWAVVKPSYLLALLIYLLGLLIYLLALLMNRIELIVLGIALLKLRIIRIESMVAFWVAVKWCVWVSVMTLLHQVHFLSQVLYLQLFEAASLLILYTLSWVLIHFFPVNSYILYFPETLFVCFL